MLVIIVCQYKHPTCKLVLIEQDYFLSIGIQTFDVNVTLLDIVYILNENGGNQYEVLSN